MRRSLQVATRLSVLPLTLIAALFSSPHLAVADGSTRVAPQIEAGIVAARLAGEQLFDPDHRFLVGGAGAVGVRVERGSIALVVELGYQRKGGEERVEFEERDDEGNRLGTAAFVRRVRADYVTVPLSFELTRRMGNAAPYLRLGTELGVLVRSHRRDSLEGSKLGFEYVGTEVREGTGRSDLGLVAGGGVAFGSHAPFLELRYVHGLAGERHGTRTELTNRAFAASIGFRL